jgi:hypothetical protein
LVQSIEREIDSIFAKYEDENPECPSIFEELLASKKTETKTIKEEARSTLLKEFDKLYSKTGISKLKQIIEHTNILLESKLNNTLINLI